MWPSCWQQIERFFSLVTTRTIFLACNYSNDFSDKDEAAECSFNNIAINLRLKSAP
jgi:hypothetical protein